MYFEDTIDETKYCGHLFGLGSSLFQNGIPYDTYIAPQTLVAVAQSVAASQSLAMQAAAAASGNNGSNLTSNSSSNSLNGSGDLSKLLFVLNFFYS